MHEKSLNPLAVGASRLVFVDPDFRYSGLSETGVRRGVAESVSGLVNNGAARAVQGGVRAALREAASRTGVTFDVLYKIAERESAFDATAKAATSSAAGLFQFIEQTWLGVVKNHGAKHGLADFAADIDRSANGRLSVADGQRRAQILDLRFDARAASALAGELITENKVALEKRLNRPVSAGGLYAAHFLGVAGAVKLLNAPRDATAADLFPAAAKSNAPVFYENGAAKTVGALLDSFETSMTHSAAKQTPASILPKNAGALTRLPAPENDVAQNDAPSIKARQTSRTLSNQSYTEIDDAVSGLRQRLSTRALAALQALDPTLLRRDKRD